MKFEKDNDNLSINDTNINEVINIDNNYIMVSENSVGYHINDEVDLKYLTHGTNIETMHLITMELELDPKFSEQEELELTYCDKVQLILSYLSIIEIDNGFQLTFFIKNNFSEDTLDDQDIFISKNNNFYKVSNVKRLKGEFLNIKKEVYDMIPKTINVEEFLQGSQKVLLNSMKVAYDKMLKENSDDNSEK